MSRSVADLMVEVALETLAEGDNKQISGLVRTFATRWPRESALSISFALTTAAAMLEDMLDSKSVDRGTVLQAYKLAALVAADAHAIQSMGMIPARGSDLLVFWRRVDPYFLDL